MLVENIKRLLKYCADMKVSIKIIIDEREYEKERHMVLNIVDELTYKCVCNEYALPYTSSQIQKLQLTEEEETFDEKQLKLIEERLKSYPNIFHKLISIFFFESKDFKIKGGERHFFYMSLQSCTCHEKPDIYFAIFNNEIFFCNNNNNEFELCSCEIKSFFKDIIGCDREELINELENKIKVCNDYDSIQAYINEFAEKINTCVEDKNYLKSGMVTLCDFLAWKGLWHQDADKILRDANILIENIRKFAKRETAKLMPLAEVFRLTTIISISDTIAIMTPHIPSVSEIELLELHATISKFILEQSVNMEFPIRGAITYGDYSFKNNIMIGPAIDEAESWHEQTDWIGIILSPRAQFLFEENKKECQHIMEYPDLPLKTNCLLKYCICWQVEESIFKKLILKTNAITKEIASKYLNTKKFFDKEMKGENND